MKPDILKNLNPEQKNAVIETEGPVLIIAGAGTGKTAVITRRIAYLIEQKLAKPEEILALTFTEKASEEMDFRVYDLLPDVFSSISVFTFHAFADSILRDIAYDVGLSPDYKILTQNQQILFLRSHLYSLSLEYFRPVNNPLKFLRDLTSFFSNLKDENITSQSLLLHVSQLEDSAESAKLTELANCFSQYEELKRLGNFVDFSDLLYLVRLAFKEHPNILTNYQNRYKYILVDEFQDTNLAQNDLVNMLCGKHHNLTVVGDDDQSIYKFRGASISNILSFKTNYPDAKQFVLTKNYRSNQGILDLAYEVIQNNNPDRLEFAAKINKKLEAAVNTSKTKPQILRGTTLSDEVELVTQKIIELNKSGKKYSDIAILSRAASHAIPFIRALENVGIPVQSVGTTSLYQTPEVKNLIFFLKTLTNFEDDLSLYHLGVSEYYSIDPDIMIKLAAYTRNRHIKLFELLETISNFDELKIPDSEKTKIETLVSDLQKYAAIAIQKNVAELLYTFLLDHKVFQTYQKSNKTEDIRKIENISKLFEKLSEFISSTIDPSVINYITTFVLLEESGDTSTTATLDQSLEAVNVLTIHSSKGLEFDSVFIINLVSDRFPSRSKSQGISLPNELLEDSANNSKQSDLQEERRLFYVAVTRAKENLFLTWAEDYGGARSKKPSQFLLESFGKQDLEVVPTKLNAIEKISRFASSEQLPLMLVQKEKKVLPNLPLKLNQDSINSYLTCPLQYRYNYLLKLPKSQTGAMVLGTAVHKSLEAFYLAKKTHTPITSEELINVYTSNFSDVGFFNAQNREELFNKGKQIISEFYQNQKNTQYENLLVEEKFNLVYDGVMITGRFDLITIDKDKTTIMDFKTSQGVDEKKAKERVNSSIQLKIYALAYKEKYHHPADEIGLYFVENNIYAKRKPDEKLYQKAMSDITKVKEGIVSENFIPKPDKFSCTNCPFNKICPASLA